MSIIKDSEVNGPGVRLVIWTQGCTKHCIGCFNPESWSSRINTEWSPYDLSNFVKSENPLGLTLSGGDPLEQSDVLLEFLHHLHDGEAPSNLRADFLPLGIICFTGYVLEELRDSALGCVDYFDLLIDGRYVERLRYSSGLAGSSNQRFHFSSHVGRGESRISRDDVFFDQAVEVHFDELDSNIIRVTGFPTINRKWLREQGLEIESNDSDVV